MPVVQRSTYRAPRWLFGGHAQTLFPPLFRRMQELPFYRSRLETPDGDFIHIDTLLAEAARAKTAIILSHGLEGDSRRKYIRGMCRVFAALGWDCVCRNFRACGGTLNRLPGMYHSGQTEDLHCVVRSVMDAGYEAIALVGFSMGGNQTLKYLGEEPERVPSVVKGAAVFSVPCHLPGAAKVLDRPGNAVYMRYFMRTLRKKVCMKHALYPDLYPLEGLERISTFAEFDSRYTAPIHGFSSAAEYWERAACLPHLARIRVPSLLVNARNDPFLSPQCYPERAAEQNTALTLEMPEEGGHVGFCSPMGQDAYWSEERAATFFSSLSLP